jgi:hypothetical protein
MVTMKKLGSSEEDNLNHAGEGGAVAHHHIRILGSSFMKRMKVKSAHPMSVWERISPRM